MSSRRGGWRWPALFALTTVTRHVTGLAEGSTYWQLGGGGQFQINDRNLWLRGEGTLMSTAQKGRNDLKLASLRRDRELVQLARDAALGIVDVDPSLGDNPLLADELDLLLTADDEAFLAKS